MKNDEQIRELHRVFRLETGLAVPLDMPKIYDWERWLAYGAGYKPPWDVDTLRSVIRYEKWSNKRTVKFFKFCFFIGWPGKFADSFAELRASKRAYRVSRTKAEAQRAIGHHDDAQTYAMRNNTKRADEVAAEFFALKHRL